MGEFHTLMAVGALLAAELLAGFALMRAGSRVGAWALVIASVAAADWLARNETPLLRMLILIVALLYAMKALVAVEERTTLPFGRWLIFAAIWFGMRASIFARERRPREAGSVGRGLIAIAAGVAIVFAATKIVKPWAFIPLVIGLSLILHFGLFNLDLALLRRAGFDVKPLFVAPLGARTLAEFWSRRWNVGFSEMTSLAVYRPLKKWNAPAATMAAFAFSGLLHEVAISLPVRAGFGLPTLYFLIQGAAVLVERKLRPSRLRTLATLVIPIPLLGHPWFVRGMLASF